MDTLSVLHRIYENLEEDRVDRALMGCFRVARNTGDFINAAFFLRELYPDKAEVGNMIFEDMKHLKPDAQKYVLDHSLELWLKIHDLGFSLAFDDEGKERTVLKVPVGEIDPEILQWEATVEDMRVPQGMSPYDTAAFTDSFVQQKAEIRLRIKALHTLKSRLRAKCLSYAIQMERQIFQQKRQQEFLDSVQGEVNNYFKCRGEDVFKKLEKAVSLANSRDVEDAALLLTAVRRAIKAVADHFFPVSEGRVICSDGIERVLDDEKYLNRLQEFLTISIQKSSSGLLLKTELDSLVAFIRRLNDLSSKGVHSAVTWSEARQGLVGLYFFLYNLIQRIEAKEG